MSRSGRDLVALLLAAALFVAVAFASASVLYGVIVNERRNLGDAATQLLTALFGGIVGILGAYVGSTKSERKEDDDAETEGDRERQGDRPR